MTPPAPCPACAGTPCLCGTRWTVVTDADVQQHIQRTMGMDADGARAMWDRLQPFERDAWREGAAGQTVRP